MTSPSQSPLIPEELLMECGMGCRMRFSNKSFVSETASLPCSSPSQHGSLLRMLGTSFPLVSVSTQYDYSPDGNSYLIKKSVIH